MPHEALHCVRCGYNRGLPENRCPECGERFEPGRIRHLFNAREFEPISFGASLGKFLLPFALFWLPQIVILPLFAWLDLKELLWLVELIWIGILGFLGLLICFDLAIRWGYSRRMGDERVPPRAQARRRVQILAGLLLAVFAGLLILNIAGLVLAREHAYG